jgi:hypothetical protein
VRFGLRPHIRRFKNKAGCTLGQEPDEDALYTDFDSSVPKILGVIEIWRNNETPKVVSRNTEMIAPFGSLSVDALSEGCPIVFF